MEKATVAMPLIGATLGDDCDLSAGGFAELGLIVRSKNFHFLDGIGVDGNVSASVVAGVDVGSAINGELVLIGARAVDVEGSDSSSARSVTIKRSRYARNELHVIQHI